MKWTVRLLFLVFCVCGNGWLDASGRTSFYTFLKSITNIILAYGSSAISSLRVLAHRVQRGVSHHHEKKEIHAIWLTPWQLEILWPAAARRSPVYSCKGRESLKWLGMDVSTRDFNTIQRFRYVSAYVSLEWTAEHRCISECDAKLRSGSIGLCRLFGVTSEGCRYALALEGWSQPRLLPWWITKSWYGRVLGYCWYIVLVDDK